MLKHLLILIVSISLTACYTLPTGEEVPIPSLLFDFDETYQKPIFQCGFYDTINPKGAPLLPEYKGQLGENNLRILRWDGYKTRAYWLSIQYVKWSSGEGLVEVRIIGESGQVLNVLQMKMNPHIPYGVFKEELSLAEGQKGQLLLKYEDQYYEIGTMNGRLYPDSLAFKRTCHDSAFYRFMNSPFDNKGEREVYSFTFEEDSLGYHKLRINISPLTYSDVRNAYVDFLLEEVHKFDYYTLLHYDSQLIRYRGDRMDTFMIASKPPPRGTEATRAGIQQEMRSAVLGELDYSIVQYFKTNGEFPVGRSREFKRKSAFLRNPDQLFTFWKVIKFVGYKRFLSPERYHQKKYELSAYRNDSTIQPGLELSFDDILRELIFARNQLHAQAYYNTFWDRRREEGTDEIVYRIIQDVYNAYNGSSIEPKPHEEECDPILLRLIEFESELMADVPLQNKRKSFIQYVAYLEELGLYQSAFSLAHYEYTRYGLTKPPKAFYSRFRGSNYKQPMERNNITQNWVTFEMESFQSYELDHFLL